MCVRNETTATPVDGSRRDLGPPRPASAAVTPVDLGVGTKPSVVVDPAGTSHVLYLPDTFGARSTAGCRAARQPATSAPRSADLDDIEQV